MPTYAEAVLRPVGSASSGVHTDLSGHAGSPPPPREKIKGCIREEIREKEKKIKNLQELLTEYCNDLEFYMYDTIEFPGDYYDDGTHFLDRMEEDCQERIWDIRNEIQTIEDSIGDLKTNLWKM